MAKTIIVLPNGVDSSHKVGSHIYMVTHKGRTFQVRYHYDGEFKGLWTVKEQSLKHKGVDHWFTKGVEETKRDALRLIEDEHYEN